MYIFYVGPWEAEVISNWFEEKIQFRDYEKNSEEEKSLSTESISF